MTVVSLLILHHDGRLLFYTFWYSYDKVKQLLSTDINVHMCIFIVLMQVNRATGELRLFWIRHFQPSVKLDTLCEMHKQREKFDNIDNHSISECCQTRCVHSFHFLHYCLALLHSKRQSPLQNHQTTSILLPSGCHWVRSRCVLELSQSSLSGTWQIHFPPDCGSTPGWLPVTHTGALHQPRSNL